MSNLLSKLHVIPSPRLQPSNTPAPTQPLTQTTNSMKSSYEIDHNTLHQCPPQMTTPCFSPQTFNKCTTFLFVFYNIYFLHCSFHCLWKWKSGFLPQTVFQLEQLQVTPSDKTTKIITWKSLCNRNHWWFEIFSGCKLKKVFPGYQRWCFSHDLPPWENKVESPGKIHIATVHLRLVRVFLCNSSSVDVELGVVFLFLFSAVICRARSYAWPCYLTKTNSSP